MIDFRQFINEAYDNEDKADVIKDFNKFLKDKYSGDERYWFAIGDGNGNYLDDRLTFGLKTSKAKDAVDTTKNVKTICFMVSDMGKLVAYLDAEDNDLLRNSAVTEWDIGASPEAEQAAFSAASKFIDNFFKDNKALYKHLDAATAYYTDAEMEKLEKELERRETYEAPFVWNAKKEQELATLRDKLKRTIKLMQKRRVDIAELEHQIDPVTGEPADKQSIEAYEEEIRDLDLTKKRLADTIADYAYEKKKYDQYIASHKNTREQQKYRGYGISAIGADRLRDYILSKEPDASDERKAKLADMDATALAAGLTDDEIKKLVGDIAKPKRRRAIKTGDVGDDEAAIAKAKKKAAVDALKAMFG